MPEISPGSASYEEALAKIAKLIQSDEQERGKIENLSKESFREWLSDALNRISAELGIAFSNAAALVADVFTIGVNAVTAFTKSYRENYYAARRIQRMR